jgi:hypothetical protein
MSLTSTPEVPFATIYATDLVFVEGCWKLCGDAHCCSFSRHKAKFKFLSKTPGQELPLLPGEYAYLSQNGYLAQFQDHEHRVVDYNFGENRTLRMETIISRRPGCACDHGTRPTICRLYPSFPVFDVDGRLTGLDRVGIYDAMEDLDGLERICKVDTMPLAEVEKLLTITTAIAAEPRALFYMMAYQLTHAYVRDRLVTLKGDRVMSMFTVFENALLRNQLIEADVLKGHLNTLADRFEARWPGQFHLP